MENQHRRGEVDLVGVFAFWRHDRFPYVLGAEVTKMAAEGVVYAPAFQGWFVPVRLVPAWQGEGVLRNLNNMRDSNNNEDEELRRQRIKTADAISGDLVSAALK